MDYEGYKEARGYWQDACTGQTKFLDQSNLTLAGGALGLTLTFLNDFKCVPDRMEWLYVGGGVLLASIVLTLLSVHASQAALISFIRRLDAAAEADFSPETVKATRGRYVNTAAKVTAYLNALASLSLVAGVALVALFVYANLDSVSSRC